MNGPIRWYEVVLGMAFAIIMLVVLGMARCAMFPGC